MTRAASSHAPWTSALSLSNCPTPLSVENVRGYLYSRNFDYERTIILASFLSVSFRNLILILGDLNAPSLWHLPLRLIQLVILISFSCCCCLSVLHILFCTALHMRLSTNNPCIHSLSLSLSVPHQCGQTFCANSLDYQQRRIWRRTAQTIARAPGRFIN